MRRKPIGAVAVTAAQRQQRRRDKLRTLRPAAPPDLLTLDAEAIAARIFEAMPPEKVDRMAAVLHQRQTLWRRDVRSAAVAIREARLSVLDVEVEALVCISGIHDLLCWRYG
jgi:hypothetical protein